MGKHWKVWNETDGTKERNGHSCDVKHTFHIN